MKHPNKNAYLTVYLALVFGVVLSLLLTLIEGAAIGAARLQSEIVADLGLDSVFAEYNRELLDQYEMFFVDSSYGTVNGGVGMVESRLSDYMGYNLNPNKGGIFNILGNTWLTLNNPYLEIEEISYATDDNALVWKSSVVNFMKSVYIGDAVSTVTGLINTVEENGLNTMDIAEQIKQDKERIDETINNRPGDGDNEIEEYGNEEGSDNYTYDKISSAIDELVGGALLNSAMPSDSSLSEATVEGGPYYSVRSKSGNINKGTGIHDGVDKASGAVDEILYNKYLMSYFGTYTEPKDKGMLKYQVEYILFGFNSDSGNMKYCVEALLALRAAANNVSIMNDNVKYSQVYSIVMPICTFLTHPELSEAFTYLILELWAFVEGYSDVRILLDNGRVPLIKSPEDWNVSFEGIFSGSLFNGSKNDKGITYNDHLEIFLGLANKGNNLDRSLDIVEMDLRLTDGNEGFRIDRCVDYIRAKFGFVDVFGHEFLLDRSKCYD
jgi:hypothetical protein